MTILPRVDALIDAYERRRRRRFWMRARVIAVGVFWCIVTLFGMAFLSGLVFP